MLREDRWPFLKMALADKLITAPQADVRRDRYNDAISAINTIGHADQSEGHRRFMSGKLIDKTLSA